MCRRYTGKSKKECLKPRPSLKMRAINLLSFQALMVQRYSNGLKQKNKKCEIAGCKPCKWQDTDPGDGTVEKLWGLYITILAKTRKFEWFELFE